MGSNKVILSESRGAYSEVVTYSDSTRHHGKSGNSEAEGRRLFATGILFTLRKIFLPHGYPDSVSKDYMSYQIFDTIQAFCSSLTNALATEAVMKSVGVGDDTATPLAAALTWLLKSGSGMLGQIVFTWSQGTKLDSDCKKWRFFADMANDMAIFIELMTPMIPANLRIAIFCLSSVTRSLVGVAGGATRAAITQHQARKNNSADVSAKDGSQETLVNLVALVTSLVMLPSVSGRLGLVWVLYVVFTGLHLMANYFALKSLQFEALNDARLLVCLESFLQRGTVPPISVVNQLECVVVGFGTNLRAVIGENYRIVMGASAGESIFASSNISDRSLESVLKHTRGAKFIISVNKNDKLVYVVLHEDISPWELVEAYARAVFLTRLKLEQEEVDVMGVKCSSQWTSFEKCLVTEGYAQNWCLLQTLDWRAKWDLGAASAKRH